MLRLLLVEGNDLIANRFVAIASEICLISRFKDAYEAQAWLIDAPQVHLIITDTKGVLPLTEVIRRNSSRPIPVLTICNYMDNRSVKSALNNGATDVLLIGEDTQSLRNKVNYYLELNSSLLALPEGKPASPSSGFTLPWWKRTVDIMVSLTALLIFSPLLLIVALLIRLDSKGPILYKSKRAGAQFKIFDMYKFRTMRVEADKMLSSLSSNNIYSKEKTDFYEDDESSDPSEFLCSVCQQQGTSCQQLLIDQDKPICEKLYLREHQEAAKFMKFRNDPRITRLGVFLRNSSIDELPQLFNILLGHMSLVGNRPLPIYEAEKLTTNELAQRFAGPAGLTGLWQVKKRAKGQGPMSDQERTFLDIEYAKTFSFKTDIYIIWQTLFSLWQQENV